MDFNWLDTAAGAIIGFVTFPLAARTWRRREPIRPAELPENDAVLGAYNPEIAALIAERRRRNTELNGQPS